MGWRNWALAVVILAVVANALWKLSPWAFGVFVAVAASVAIHTLIEHRRARKLGYSIEHLSPGQLRGGENEIAVVYHEGDNEIVFSGIERSRPNRTLIYVPGPKQWDTAVESWARGRRSEIVGRLLKDRIVKRHEIVEGGKS
jgi:hypothetical protein